MSLNEKAIENIRALIEQQETDWLKDNGFDPIPHKPEPRILRRKVKEGNFSADRFLGMSAAPEQEPHEQEPHEQEPQHEHDDSPEAVEIITQKDGRHSWLYNEVMKAIRDAAGDGKNTKVIAIFVPVVQNGKEFEDLPVSASVELSPVDEDAVRIDAADLHVAAEPEPEPAHEEEHLPEPLEEPELEPAPVDHVGDLFPAPQAEPDPELAEAFTTMEEKLDEQIAESHEEELEPAESMPFIEEEPAGLLPLPDPAEIEAFNGDDDAALDEEIDEGTSLVDVPEQLQESEEPAFPEDEIIDEPEEISAGEKMSFTEIHLPPSLEDDEVLDDSIDIQDDNNDNIKL